MKALSAKAAILFAAAASMTAVSCQKDDNIPGAADKNVDIRLSVVTDLTTKATLNETAESTVYTVDYFVFNNDGNGKLDCYSHVEGKTDVTLSCKAGSKKIYALVNSYMTPQQLDAISSLQEFLNTAADLKKQNPEKLEMIGSVTKVIEDAETISISVQRMVARIGIQNIKVAFLSPYLKNTSLHISGIYLLNSVTTFNYGMNMPLTYSMFSNHKEFIRGTVMTASSNERDILNGTTAEINEYFYTFPNNTKDDVHDTTDAPRKTRLVIETKIGTRTYYYPITIEGSNGIVEANKAYTIGTLTITREGSDDADLPLEFDSAKFGISVSPWVAEPTTDKNI